MLFKKNCSVCNNKYSKSKLKEYETIEGRKIISCEKCIKFFKLRKKN